MAKYLVVDNERNDTFQVIDADSARAAVILTGYVLADVWTLRGHTPRHFTVTVKTETVVEETP